MRGFFPFGSLKVRMTNKNMVMVYMVGVTFAAAWTAAKMRV